ncbi:biotin-dependent carboxyltransferase family protein [Arthrobacter cavernae]|uniref:Biotin-dependent carboxyltransferase family protein n=1 Tax=Arthrobacter cavernae TaxID=2817681 RepID=A0A939HHC0_9MICC|nr:biotin-dependent carboxyltransferase family protein [Arthrobacter cavernae]MBO1269269.1 biotin-dependent carboxyltransferase family protein [Arthrobacter cavernae]
MGAVVMDPGALTLVLGAGRALDRAALLLANALLGNPGTAPGLEVLLGGLRLRFVTASAVAVTGAEGMVQLNGAEVPLNQPVRVAPGSVLDFGPALFGIRYYLAVQGGIEPGLEPLRAGDSLAFGRPAGANPVVANPAVAEPHSHLARRAPDPGRPIVVRVDPGPQAGEFDADSWHRLTNEPWTLSPDSDRVGARLLGRPLAPHRTQARTQVAASQGLVAGAVQVPPSGLPHICLADHPATGNHPVIAVVQDADLDLLAQARPGQAVHLLG